MSTLAYYRTEERRAALVAEARSWQLTPFAENCAIKGMQGGVDCVHFLAACHVKAGACERPTLPHVPVEQVRHWHEHHRESLVMAWLEAPELRGRVRRVNEDEPPMIGDLVIVKIRETEHHVGLWCGHEVLHVAIPAGVVAHSVRDPEFMRLVRCYYRIYEA